MFLFFTESNKNSGRGNLLFVEISGRFSFGLVTSTMRINHGGVYCGAISLLRQAEPLLSLLSNEQTRQQSFKHIFTSPSSVEKEAKATRSGNARLHGMTSVTPASITYVATQVRHLQKSLALPTFHRLGLLWHRRLSSLVQIRWQIPNYFITAFSTF